MPRRVYYKVCKMLSNRRVSCWARKFAQINYPPKGTITAPCGSMGIFVFDNHDDAINWTWHQEYFDNNKSYAVIKCYGHGRPRRPKKILKSFVSNIIDNFQSISHDPRWTLKFNWQEPPPGTVVFRSITLLE